MRSHWVRRWYIFHNSLKNTHFALNIKPIQTLQILKIQKGFRGGGGLEENCSTTTVHVNYFVRGTFTLMTSFFNSPFTLDTFVVQLL